jgi:hypothetical protein
MPVVKRRHNAEGVGGLDGSSLSHLVGTIMMFYTFCVTGLGAPVTATFVEIKRRPIEYKVRSLYIIQTIGVDDSLLKGLEHQFSDDHVLVHVDSITHKLKVVPHFDAQYEDALMCAIPMW